MAIGVVAIVPMNHSLTSTKPEAIGIGGGETTVEVSDNTRRAHLGVLGDDGVDVIRHGSIWGDWGCLTRFCGGDGCVSSRRAPWLVSHSRRLIRFERMGPMQQEREQTCPEMGRWKSTIRLTIPV